MTPECCSVMDLALSRVRPNDRVGLSRELMMQLNTGKSYHRVVVRFAKAPRGDKSPHASATYAPVNFCPFCGKKQGSTP